MKNIYTSPTFRELSLRPQRGIALLVISAETETAAGALLQDPELRQEIDLDPE